MRTFLKSLTATCWILLTVSMNGICQDTRNDLLRLIPLLESEVIDLQERLDSKQYQNDELRNAVSALQDQVDDLKRVVELKEVSEEELKSKLEDLRDNLVKANRKVKLFKVATIVGFALVPVALIYGMLAIP